MQQGDTETRRKREQREKQEDRKTGRERGVRRT